MKGHMRVWICLLESRQTANMVYVAMGENHKPQMTTANLFLKPLEQEGCIFFPRGPGIDQHKVRSEL